MLEAMKRKFENFGVENLELKWPQSYPEHSHCQHSYDDDEEEEEEGISAGAVKGVQEKEEEKIENSEFETSSSSTESFVEVHEEEEEEEEEGTGEDSNELSRRYSFNHVTFSSDMEFLKEKHQSLLSDLHRQIDELREKNRELQYKLVMRESSPESSRPSSSDKLRRTIQDLQAELIKVQTQNKLLSKLLEEQRGIKDLKERGAERFKSLPRLENRGSHHLSHDEQTSSTIPFSISLESLRRLESVYLRRMEEAEERIFQLQKENQEQRNELLDLKADIFKADKLKYRGCNHPSRLRSFSSSKTSLENLSSSQLLGRPKRSRTESLDRFPALPPFKSRSRSGLGSELPPVPGSSGSESSSSMKSSSRQHINLITLKPSQSGTVSSDNLLPRFLNKKLKKSKTKSSVMK